MWAWRGGGTSTLATSNRECEQCHLRIWYLPTHPHSSHLIPSRCFSMWVSHSRCYPNGRCVHMGRGEIWPVGTWRGAEFLTTRTCGSIGGKESIGDCMWRVPCCVCDRFVSVTDQGTCNHPLDDRMANHSLIFMVIECWSTILTEIISVMMRMKIPKIWWINHPSPWK